MHIKRSYQHTIIQLLAYRNANEPSLSFLNAIYTTIWINRCSLDVVTVRITSEPYIIQKFYFNEFVANVLHDKIGSKKWASNVRKKMRPFFSVTYQKFRVRVNHTITHTIAQSKWFWFLFCTKMLPQLEF